MTMIPDKTVMCHRTGFTKSCFECVTQHGCRLWQHITLEGDPTTAPGAAVRPVDHWDCVDSLMALFMRDMLRRQLQTTATVDKAVAHIDKTTHAVREVGDAQAVAMIHSLRMQLPPRPDNAVGYSGEPIMIDQMQS